MLHKHGRGAVVARITEDVLDFINHVLAGLLKQQQPLLIPSTSSNTITGSRHTRVLNYSSFLALRY